ncbi:MAG: RNA 2',3'-cyclic phosphodiesterase, partial [Methanomicrobiales archaeon]|nr:RNA 2',3'-cyclic phosphodiesterase [Methanomicrobiales archaeon]
MTRLFVAVEIPVSLSDDIAAFQRSMSESSAQVTYVSPSLMHITLKFIGEVDERDVGAFSSALNTVFVAPFSLSTKGIEFNNKKQPRVLWLRMHTIPALLELVEKVEQVLGSCGIKKESRRFHPHITIARIKQASPDLFTLVDSYRHSCSCTFDV